MGQLDKVLGPMVIGTILSVFFSGIMLVQCYNYFVRFPNDPSWMKFMVAYLLVLDFVHAGVESAVVYQYTVTLFGDLKGILFAVPLFAAVPILSVSISSVAQGFFAWRVGRLTRIPLLGWFIGILAVVQFLCGIGVTIAVTIVTSFLEFVKFQGVVIPWLACSVLCDVLITVSLCWYLQTNKSGMTATDDLVTKLIRNTIQTGAMTAAWAIADLIVYRTENNSLHLIFNFPLAKIYTLSLLSTLHSRRSHAEALRGPNNNSGYGGNNGFMSDGSGTTSGNWPSKSGRGQSTGKTAIGFTASMPKWGRNNSVQMSSTLSQTPIEIEVIKSKYTHSSRTHDIPIGRSRGDPMEEDGPPTKSAIDEDYEADEFEMNTKRKPAPVASHLDMA